MSLVPTSMGNLEDNGSCIITVAYETDKEFFRLTATMRTSSITVHTSRKQVGKYIHSATFMACKLYYYLLNVKFVNISFCSFNIENVILRGCK
jgi:hypothetical protein